MDEIVVCKRPSGGVCLQWPCLVSCNLGNMSWQMLCWCFGSGRGIWCGCWCFTSQNLKHILSRLLVIYASSLPPVLVSLFLSWHILFCWDYYQTDFSTLQNLIWSPPDCSFDQNSMFLSLSDKINTVSKRTLESQRRDCKTCSFKRFSIVYLYCCEVSS